MRDLLSERRSGDVGLDCGCGFEVQALEKEESEREKR
jgi:hypothetical protein